MKCFLRMIICLHLFKIFCKLKKINNFGTFYTVHTYCVCVFIEVKIIFYKSKGRLCKSVSVNIHKR